MNKGRVRCEVMQRMRARVFFLVVDGREFKIFWDATKDTSPLCVVPTQIQMPLHNA
jgi:hypothetical protein